MLEVKTTEPAAPAPVPHLAGQSPLYKVVSHSNLFYFWPVWLLGFIMAIISSIGGGRLAIVPAGTTVKAVAPNKGKTFELTVPGAPTESLTEAAAAKPGQEAFPYHIAQSPTFHLIYVIVVLGVTLASSVLLRGLWSVINLMGILVLALLFYILGWWGPILRDLGQLHLYISAEAYLFPSLVLFIYWALVVFVFDQRRFIIFSPGQIIVHKEVGDRQEVYDTASVTVVKRLNDFIRHDVLGMGAGDLIVSTADGRHQFELPNVLFADRKIREISEAMKIRPVMEQ